MERVPVKDRRRANLLRASRTMDRIAFGKYASD